MQAIVKLRALGVPYVQIAAGFNARGVPAPSGGVWGERSVMTVCLNAGVRRARERAAATAGDRA